MNNSKRRRNVRDNMVTRLTRKADAELAAPSLAPVKLLLEEALLLECRPAPIEGLCKWVEAQGYSGSKARGEASAHFTARALMALVPYRFFFDTGAISQHRTLYASSHAEAWAKAAAAVTDEFEGVVRAVFCYKYGAIDPGTLRSLHGFFTPKVDGAINCCKADDLLPGWAQQEEPKPTSTGVEPAYGVTPELLENCDMEPKKFYMDPSKVQLTVRRTVPEETCRLIERINAGGGSALGNTAAMHRLEGVLAALGHEGAHFDNLVDVWRILGVHHRVTADGQEVFRLDRNGNDIPGS
jgi:hypothetical protein